MVESTSPEARLAAIGIETTKIQNLMKNKKTAEKFIHVLDLIGNPSYSCPKERGSLFETVATKVKDN